MLGWLMNKRLIFHRGEKMESESTRKICGLNRNIFFTGLVSFFMDFSSEMVYPLVPLFLSSVLGVQKSVIGLIEGIAESTARALMAADIQVHSILDGLDLLLHPKRCKATLRF
jgi:hypothetical protein